MPVIVWPQYKTNNNNKKVLDYSLQILDATCDKGPMRVNNISDNNNKITFLVVISSILGGCALIVIGYIIFTKHKQRQLTIIDTTTIATTNVREPLVKINIFISSNLFYFSYETTIQQHRKCHLSLQ